MSKKSSARNICMAIASFCVTCIFATGCCFLFGPNIEDEPRPERPPAQNGAERSAPQPGGLGAAPAAQGGQQLRKRPVEAERAYSEALALWEKSSLGEVCSDPQRATALLDKAVSLAPEYGEAYLRRGLAKSELNEPEEAFEDATRGLRLVPTAESYALRGLVLMRGRQNKAARRDLEYSLSTNPSQHLAHNLLGALALSEEKDQEACASFKAGCDNGDCFFLETARKEKICP